MRDLRRIARILLVPLTILLFGLLAPLWGTLPVAVALIFLNGLVWAERPTIALVSALAVCVAAVLFFARVMHVPLPIGAFLDPWF